jgi:hypothetical protein|tara:strand:+ start:854 stop:1183 length:330 start_codon:yes stop_codon:yes gene_type:complete
MEAKMTHNLQTQTFNFDGKTFKKGVDSYNYSDAMFIVERSEKTLISYVDDDKKIIHHGEISNPAEYLEDNNRILVSKRGNALGCIIYLGNNQDLVEDMAFDDITTWAKK